MPHDFTLHLGDFSQNGTLAPTSPLDKNFYPSCHQALIYLRTLHSASLQQITGVFIPHHFMAADDGDNTWYADELQSFLETKLALKYVSLEVPDDMDAGREGDQYQFLTWKLHKYMIDAFKKGRISMLRFVHPRQYTTGPQGLNIFEYYNVYVYLESFVLEEYQDLLEKLRGRNWASGFQTPEQSSNWIESIRNIWLQAGYLDPMGNWAPPGNQFSA
jgi:hypothetical protein